MANVALAISALVACTSPTSNDELVLAANAGSNTERCTVANFLNNTSANVSMNVVTGAQLLATDNTTPSNSTATVAKGRIWYDDDYLYIAIGDDMIKRITLETF